MSGSSLSQDGHSYANTQAMIYDAFFTSRLGAVALRPPERDSIGMEDVLEKTMDRRHLHGVEYGGAVSSTCPGVLCSGTPHCAAERAELLTTGPCDDVRE